MQGRAPVPGRAWSAGAGTALALAPAAVAVLLLGAALAGPGALAAVLLPVQVLLVLALPVLTQLPGAGAVAVPGVAGAVAADVVVLAGDGAVDGLAEVVALGFVVALLVQLGRRDRARVTESLALTLLALVVASSAACLVALHERAGGREMTVVVLAAAASTLAVGRLGDRVAARPALTAGTSRAWAGLLLGLAAGAAVAVAAGRELGVAGADAALLGLAAAAAVAVADLAADLAHLAHLAADPAADVAADPPRRSRVLRAAAVLLPFAVLGPVALVTGQAVVR